MAVATGDRAGTGAAGAFTWDALQTLPDDNLRRELVDGQLLVSPPPSNRHQLAVGRLHLLLDPPCPGGFQVLLSPCAWKISETTMFEPDLMVVRRSQLDLDHPFTGTPLLVVEVRSPSTAATDRTLKHDQYARHGAAAYWLVDPGGPEAGQVPSLTALHLVDGAYAVEATVRDTEPYRAERPFPVTVVPADLVR
jgi:Uma2 family endonuclease